MINFGSGILYAVVQNDATGAAVANGTPVQFGALQDVGVDFSFEEKLLYGSKKFPIAMGQGKGKIAIKAKTASVNGAIIGDLVLGSGTTLGIKGIVQNYAAAVPAISTYTITVTPPSSGTWSSDLGVINATTGLPMKKVAATPAAGQYSVAAGVYTFASADASAAVLISYEYTASSTSAKYGLITNQLMGYAPSFKMYLTNQYGGNQLNLMFNYCTSSKLALPMKNDDFSIPDMDVSAFDGPLGVGYWASTE